MRYEPLEGSLPSIMSMFGRCLEYPAVGYSSDDGSPQQADENGDYYACLQQRDHSHDLFVNSYHQEAPQLTSPQHSPQLTELTPVVIPSNVDASGVTSYLTFVARSSPSLKGYAFFTNQ